MTGETRIPEEVCRKALSLMTKDGILITDYSAALEKLSTHEFPDTKWMTCTFDVEDAVKEYVKGRVFSHGFKIGKDWLGRFFAVYGSDHIGPKYYYSLGDGRWLITDLTGSDIEQVIKFIKGEEPDFTIEWG